MEGCKISGAATSLMGGLPSHQMLIPPTIPKVSMVAAAAAAAEASARASAASGVDAGAGRIRFVRGACAFGVVDAEALSCSYCCCS